MQLSEMMRAIHAKWPWNDNNYPGYDSLAQGRAREIFRLKHVLLHLVKQSGIIAAAIERLEHNPSEIGPSHPSRVDACGKLLVNVLNLATQSGVRSDDLEDWLSRNYPQPLDSKP